MSEREFGNRVKYFRNQLGMTQSQLGKNLGVSQVTIANYERGLRFPKEQQLVALGENLSVSLNELLGLKTKIQTPETPYSRENFLEILLHEDSEKALTYIKGWKTKFFLSTEQIFTSIFIPLLKQLGEKWSEHKIIISQEHLVSEKIRSLIMTLSNDEMNLRRVTPDKNKRWLGVCAPFEQHELVLLMASQLMKFQGYDVYYLGKSVPLSDLQSMIDKIDPHIIVFSITMDEHKNELEAYLKGLIIEGERTLIVGGRGINAQVCHGISKNINYAETLEEAIEISQKR